MTRVIYSPERRYPFVPECECGVTFRGYLTEEAARNVADDHDCPTELEDPDAVYDAWREREWS